MAARQDHGDRNQSLSQDLRKTNVYYDWCVTTSFYSVIHFVEDKIFPISLNGVKCNNISEAKKELNLDGRHASRLKLVYQVFGYSLGAKYQWLENRSRTARYVSYKTTSAEADKALQYCNEIKKACYPE